MVLVGVLLFFVLLGALFIYQHVFLIRELRQLQFEALRINNNRNIAQALLNDAMEYSKRNPALDPVLESLGAKPRSGAAASPAPASVAPAAPAATTTPRPPAR